MVKEIWTAANVRISLLRRIKKALESEEAKEEGLNNVNQFIDSAIRELLEKLEQKRMNHLNMYDDHVKIMDNKLGKIGRIVSVYFKKGNKPWCDYCRESDCIHVQYAWEIADVRKILEKYRFSPPPSRV